MLATLREDGSPQLSPVTAAVDDAGRVTISTRETAFKIKHIRRFLEEGNKAKITVRFRGREITHPEKGREVIDEILKALEGLIVIESNATMEGKAMTVLIAPKPGTVKRVEPVPGAPAAPGAPPAKPASPSAPHA